jgi:tryptophan halogenase
MSKLKKVDTIVIVGGGTSAWITAALLSKTTPHLNITIVDKEDGAPLGVGEGTLLSFDKIMDRCGFMIDEWFFEIDATAKSGILFPGWGENQENVWHPFTFPHIPQLDTTQLNLWSKNQQYDFKRYGLALYDVSVEHDAVDISELRAYAFHIDAGKLVKFIQKKLADRLNVHQIRSDVVDIVRDNTGHVTELLLKSGEKITADLYVDCTGFKQLLAHKPDRVELNGRLFCDTAIAGHVPYENKEDEMHPFVVSEQVEHGWVWNIPVQTRIGSGLVFNRSCTDIEEAKDAFCEYWNHRIKKENLKVIDWTPYYNKNQWHENVVSIGLSAGFLEPLESTGVALIIVGAEQLAFALTPRCYNDLSVRSFNTIMEGYFEDCIDFVSMHYDNPTRKGKLWDLVRKDWVKPEKQKMFEETMQREDVPLPVSGFGYVFAASNWICWLIQLGKKLGKANDGLTPEQAENELLRYYEFESSRHTRSMHHVRYIDNIKEKVKNDKV